MSDITRCEPDDPHRCQGSCHQGQCPNKAMSKEPEGFYDYCRVHGGPSQAHAAKVKRVTNYRLERWKFKADLQDKINSPALKDLRDEVAILRVVLQTTLDACTDETILLIKSHAIADLVSKIDKTVNSCHKLEGSMGQHFDKHQLLNFASQVIDIISNNVPDTTVVNSIADEIITAAGSSSHERI